MLRQMRRWAIDQSDQGPVYLGYRLGHIKGEGRVFRALVYNKGAMVLHMLRRLVGDDKFFEGLRQFYGTWKFRKAGTDDFRRAMEKALGPAISTASSTAGFTDPRCRSSASRSTLAAGRGANPVRTSRHGDPDPGHRVDPVYRRVASRT